MCVCMEYQKYDTVVTFWVFGDKSSWRIKLTLPSSGVQTLDHTTSLFCLWIMMRIIIIIIIIITIKPVSRPPFSSARLPDWAYSLFREIIKAGPCQHNHRLVRHRPCGSPYYRLGQVHISRSSGHHWHQHQFHSTVIETHIIVIFWKKYVPHTPFYQAMLSYEEAC